MLSGYAEKAFATGKAQADASAQTISHSAAVPGLSGPGSLHAGCSAPATPEPELEGYCFVLPANPAWKTSPELCLLAVKQIQGM